MLGKLTELTGIVLLLRMKRMKLYDFNQPIRFYLIIVVVNYRKVY